MVTDTCAHCGQRLEGNVTVGPEGVWVHPQCMRAYVYAAGSETDTAFMYDGPPPPEQDRWRYPLSPDG